jgi:hypothetical protein
MSGDKAVLDCPIQPGALLQQYSVRWTKDHTPIAAVLSPQGELEHTDPRYQIDRDRYSLIIDSVIINDTSTDYLCELFVTIPISRSKYQLQPTMTLSLEVVGRYSYSLFWFDLRRLHGLLYMHAYIHCHFVVL